MTGVLGRKTLKTKIIGKEGSMERKLLGIILLLFTAGFLVFSAESQAMPNFARKYGTDCTMCHTQVPKLNKLGYEFRIAGFRLPSEIGKEEKPFNLGDFFSARAQEQYKWLKHSDVTAGKGYTSSQLEFFELTIYPLTGSWGKNFASLGEFSMGPDDVFEVENAFVRGVYGNDNGWFQARIGVMHPWEGFGASDRPIGTIRPLFQKVPAIGSPFFLWNLDESAIEAGYHLGKAGTSISARISNGIIWKEDGSGVAEPAQGGSLTKERDMPGYNDKNYQLFVNQFITKDSAVSLYYYYGVVPFPDPHYAATVKTTVGNIESTVETRTEPTLDTFQRLAIYANYFVLPEKINLLAGYAYGNDKLDDSSIITPDHKYSGSKVGNSHGYFGEVDFHATPNLALGARYDFYDPSNKVDKNNQTAITISGNYYILNGLQLVGDYQHKEIEQSGSGKNKDDQVVARLIFIW